MIFPKTSFNQDGRYSSLLKHMEKCYIDSVSYNQAYWAEAAFDTRVEAGDQTIWPERYQLTAFQRKQFNFNRTRRIVEMISGHQRRNRNSITVIPVENNDELTADQFTKIMMWLNRQEGILETISDAFHGAVVTGLSLLHVWADYRNDPISGDIKVDNCAYNSFLMDPYWRKQDLSDCNYIWKRSYLSPADAASIMPQHKEEIYQVRGSSNGKDGKFMYMPENYGVDSARLLAYDEFYYRTYRKQNILVDMESGETLEWTFDDKETLDRFLMQYPQVKLKKTTIPTVNMAVVIEGRVFYDGPNPLGIDTYPFVPVVAYYNPQLPSYSLRLQGVVRGLRDAQFLYNRRKVIELATLESQVNSGWVYKEDALVDPSDVFMTGEGKGIALKATAQMGDIQRIEAPAIPPTTIELSRILGEELNQISGVSEELLGAATDDKAGILSMLRQGAALTTLQSLFDKLDYSQKLLGRIMLKVVQNNFSPGKVKRIIEQEPSQQFYNKHFGKYDCAVEDGINTTTQRQQALAQALHLREVGIPIPDEFIIENTTLQNKTELIQMMQQQQQAQQQQQQMAQQVQMQETQARTELAQSRAMADRGLGLERASRVDENISAAIENRAEAAKDRMSGVLDIVKSLKELESIDLGNLRTLIELTKVLQAQELGAKVEAKQEEAQNLGEVRQPQTVSPQQETMVEESNPILPGPTQGELG